MLLLCFALGACTAPPDWADGEIGAGAVGTETPAAVPVEATDDAGRTVRLARPAERVVSLIPSATETLFALGAGDRVVGRTDYDEAPEARHLPSVGGGLDPSLEALISLRPDLVVVWEETRDGGVRGRLADAGIPTFSVRTRDTTDVFRTIERLGALTGRAAAADSLASDIRGGLAEVRASVAGRPEPTVFFIVSTDPPMTAGPNTFIAQLIGIAGGRSVFPDVPIDWPTVSLEEVVRRQPEVVVRPMRDPGPRGLESLRAAPGWRDVRAVREGRVAAVSANLVNRPGPHIAEAARALRDALHPDADAGRP